MPLESWAKRWESDAKILYFEIDPYWCIFFGQVERPQFKNNCNPTAAWSSVLILKRHYAIYFAFSKIFRFLQSFIASWITQIWLIAAKLTFPRNMLRTSNSFARSDTGVVIDSELHPSRTRKTSLLFALLAVRVQAGCSAFPF